MTATILVTGSTSGIGLGIAKAFAANVNLIKESARYSYCDDLMS